MRNDDGDDGDDDDDDNDDDDLLALKTDGKITPPNLFPRACI